MSTIRQEIYIDFRYRLEYKDDQLKFFLIMPWFMATLPIVMLFIVWFVMPWVVSILVSIILLLFVGIMSAWRTVTIDREKKEILKKWKSYNILLSSKKYPYYSKVFFHFLPIEYEEGKGYELLLRINYQTIHLLDTSSLADINRVKEFLIEKGFTVKSEIV